MGMGMGMGMGMSMGAGLGMGLSMHGSPLQLQSPLAAMVGGWGDAMGCSPQALAMYQYQMQAQMHAQMQAQVQAHVQAQMQHQHASPAQAVDELRAEVDSLQRQLAAVSAISRPTVADSGESNEADNNGSELRKRRLQRFGSNSGGEQ